MIPLERYAESYHPQRLVLVSILTLLPLLPQNIPGVGAAETSPSSSSGAASRARHSCHSLLDSPQPSELQTATVRAIAQPHNAGAPTQMLASARWKNFTPAVRGAVLSTLLARPQFLPGLLDAVESGALPASALDSSQRNQLLKHKDETIHQRAATLYKTPRRRIG